MGDRTSARVAQAAIKPVSDCLAAKLRLTVGQRLQGGRLGGMRICKRSTGSRPEGQRVAFTAGDLRGAGSTRRPVPQYGLGHFALRPLRYEPNRITGRGPGCLTRKRGGSTRQVAHFERFSDGQQPSAFSLILGNMRADFTLKPGPNLGPRFSFSGLALAQVLPRHEPRGGRSHKGQVLRRALFSESAISNGSRCRNPVAPRRRRLGRRV